MNNELDSDPNIFPSSLGVLLVLPLGEKTPMTALNSAYERMIAARAAIRDHQNESDFNRAIMEALVKDLNTATDQYIAELANASERKPARPALISQPH